MWNASLSTMWAIGRFRELGSFFEAGQQLGFEAFELNHQVDSRMLDGLNLGRYRISGVHEPCPSHLPVATLKARDWLVSSDDEDNRKQAVSIARRSIDLAEALGAPVVVLHAGQVDIDPERERALWDLYEAGQAGTPRYHDMKADLVTARASVAEQNLAAAVQSVAELAKYANGLGIRLGLENRYHYLDIPLPDELDSLLEAVGHGPNGFLYDVGHAQALNNLGFVAHEEWLQRQASRIIGVHLHDIRGLEDHGAAGRGEVDWDMVARYLPRDAVRTVEVHASNTPEQIAASLQFLADKGCVSTASVKP
jgi:sugar phosphate isomerase/epimerase